ncbi:hypothetical protein [Acanthopleuribacter pedis]|uniref:TIGR02270 family protein n=1 Tax=Acanthopleuribacter pedis TaxID=442870 RepID=A0A8J7U408_9BACT|nr:hypothetical protein [Acanthopleuribacter pedis]MBO1319319.1 hypothetical protein [Acanthopleuribacter pedis]
MFDIQNDSLQGSLPVEAQHAMDRFISALDRREDFLNDPFAAWSPLAAMEQRIWECGGEILAQPEIYADFIREMTSSRDTRLVRAGIWLSALMDQGIEQIGTVLENTDDLDEPETAAFLKALGRGLESVAGEKTLPLIYILARAKDPVRRTFAAAYLGYRRLNIPMLLLTLIEDDDEAVAAEAAITAGKLGVIELRPRLENSMRERYRTGDLAGRDHLALALHLLGSPLPGLHARACLQAQEPISNRLAMLMAIDGRMEDEVFFHQMAANPEQPKFCRHILAAWGFPQAVPMLIDALSEHPDKSAAVADALYQITAAPLWHRDDTALADAEVITEDLEDAEAFDEESLDSLDMESLDGEDSLEMHTAEEPPQPSIDPMRWHHWWLDHQDRFDSETRYRFGRPLHADVLLSQLGSEHGCLRERRRALWELARCKGFGPGMAFEPDWWSQHQYHYLAILKERLNGASDPEA